ncbi:MAG: hypothetical protein RLZZ385_1820 [Pseudomonadota bacterium]|jgi:hypothetical protein
MRLRLLALLAALLPMSMTHAEPLWRVLDNGTPVTASVSLPGNAIDIQPVSIPAAALAAVTTDDRLQLVLLNETLDFTVTDRQRFLNGDDGLRAVLADSPYHVVSMTIGAEDLLLTVYAPAGKFLVRALRTDAGFEGFLYREAYNNERLPADTSAVRTGSREDALRDPDAAGNDLLKATGDVLVDTDGDGISDYNESLLKTDPNNPNSGPGEGQLVEVDLLLLYTQAYVSDAASGNALTELNQLIQQTNDMFSSSGVGVRFRPVMYRQINHTLAEDIADDLMALGERTGIFANVDYLRAISGADLVVLMDGKVPESQQTCGIANGAGDGTLGDFSNERAASQTVVFAPSEGCEVDTLAHELGHLFGLVHARTEQPGGGGTFPWALGHGVNDSFRTIMAYDTHFPGSELIPIFSNPNRSDCKGQPCGVSRTDETNGADAVLALQTTRFQVARYSGTRPSLVVVNASGAATNAAISAGVIRTGGSNGIAAEFATTQRAQDRLSLVASVTVDPAHVGRTGVTHVVISAPGVGFFQVDSNGGYVPWDANPASLLGTIAPRPLQAIEELTAFSDLSFASLGFNQLSLTVYFAYSLTGTDTLVYTSAGVPLVIE